MRNRFDSLAKIRDCRRPLLVLHGTRDHLVPFAQGQRLFVAAVAPKRFVTVKGASHNDSVTADFFPVLRRFLAELVDDQGGEKRQAALAGRSEGPTISIGTGVR